MKTTTTMMMVLWVMVFVTAEMMSGSNGSWTHRRTVNITNTLEGGEELRVHCKSRDDDLGEHVLGTKQSFIFSFRERFIGQTLFYCGFDFDGQHHHFDVYIQGKMKCTQCDWSVIRAGPCLIADHQSKVYCDPWEDQ